MVLGDVERTRGSNRERRKRSTRRKERQSFARSHLKYSNKRNTNWEMNREGVQRQKERARRQQMLSVDRSDSVGTSQGEVAYTTVNR